MQSQTESKGLVILFIGVWWALTTYGPPGDFSFVLALGMMGLLWLAVRGFRMARLRLGWQAVSLAGEAVFAAFAFLGIAPGNGVQNALLVWGVGLPLLFIAAGARFLYEEHAELRSANALEAAQVLFATWCVLFPVRLWLNGMPLFDAVLRAVFLTSCGLVPLYFGWRFGEPPAPHRIDAKFADDESFKQSGKYFDL